MGIRPIFVGVASTTHAPTKVGLTPRLVINLTEQAIAHLFDKDTLRHNIRNINFKMLGFKSWQLNTKVKLKCFTINLAASSKIKCRCMYLFYSTHIHSRQGRGNYFQHPDVWDTLIKCTFCDVMKQWDNMVMEVSYVWHFPQLVLYNVVKYI